MTNQSKIGSSSFLIVVLIVCSSWSLLSSNEPTVHTVEIRLLKFQPAELTVKSGDKVTWINRDYLVHDVTEFSGKAWSSDSLKRNESWSLTIEKSADYHCTIHPIMKGKIIVE